jgi:DNA-directed RNA polymerase specialized sigma24 family protein
MQIEQAFKYAADLHWLAYLLTGRRDTSVDIAAGTVAEQQTDGPYFTAWMSAWSRRIVMAKALGGIREELAASAERIASVDWRKKAAPGRDFVLDPGTTKADIEQALLAIDLFPRASVVLRILEGVPVADAGVLLDAKPDLIRKAQAIGLMELTENLARTADCEASHV